MRRITKKDPGVDMNMVWEGPVPVMGMQPRVKPFLKFPLLWALALR